MAVKADYQTRPIESWQRMKELRRWHFHHTWEAQKQGEVMVMGIVEFSLGLFAGLGDFANPSYGPYYTVLTRNTHQLVKELEATESYGFGRDICASMRLHLGQLLLGHSTSSPKGDTFKPDFILQACFCHSLGRTGQFAGHHLGVPFYTIDFPHTDTPNRRRYLVDQFNDAIEWMEKVTGRTYDDEKLIEATRNEWETQVLWAKICELNQAVPAPLDLRQMWSLRLPAMTIKHRKECVDYFHMLHDEVKGRVADGISARGFEKARLVHDLLPPYFAINLLRFPERYGALFIAGEAAFGMCGAWDIDQEGNWKAAVPPWEKGRGIHTRQDALDAQAELYLNHVPCILRMNLNRLPGKAYGLAKGWKADGVVLHMDRGCNGVGGGVGETRNFLQDEGVPVVTYEGSHVDPRDFDFGQVSDQIESLLERLGLAKMYE